MGGFFPPDRLCRVLNNGHHVPKILLGTRLPNTPLLLYRTRRQSRRGALGRDQVTEPGNYLFCLREKHIQKSEVNRERFWGDSPKNVAYKQTQPPDLFPLFTPEIHFYMRNHGETRGAAAHQGHAGFCTQPSSESKKAQMPSAARNSNAI